MFTSTAGLHAPWTPNVERAAPKPSYSIAMIIRELSIFNAYHRF
jgi:hypothetical protein